MVSIICENAVPLLIVDHMDNNYKLQWFSSATFYCVDNYVHVHKRWYRIFMKHVDDIVIQGYATSIPQVQNNEVIINR